MNAPYLLRDTAWNMYWVPATLPRTAGHWSLSALYAAQYPTKASAEAALRAIRCGNEGRARIEIVAADSCIVQPLMRSA